MNNSKEKPEIRELTLEKGIKFPSDIELIMMILGSGTKSTSVEKLSEKVWNTISLHPADDLIPSLLKINGIGESKALTIAASLELGRRFSCHKNARIGKATDLLPFVRHYSLSRQEHFITVTLTGANEIIDIHIASMGTVNSTTVHPREVFSYALKENASAIIVCHNHPSGNCTPSEADKATTKRLVRASNLLGIPIVDHLIISQNQHFSFFEHKMLEDEEFD